MQKPWMETRKAKKVKHLGFNFDSHLEARWATVFNELDIHFNYEPDHISSFYSEKSLPTTPDFFIPKWDIWFEAKDPTKWSDEDWREVIFLKACTTVEKTNTPVWVSYGGFGSKPYSAYEFFWILPPIGSALQKYHDSFGHFFLLQGWVVPGNPVDMFLGFPLEFVDQKTDRVYLSGEELLIPLTNSPGFDFLWAKDIEGGRKTLYLGDGDTSLEGDNVYNLKPMKPELFRYLRAYEKAKLTKFHRYTKPEYYQDTNKASQVWL